MRKQWEARCRLDFSNAYEQAKVRNKNECESTYGRAADTTLNRIGALACVSNIDSKAREYAQTVFDACMSGAPN